MSMPRIFAARARRPAVAWLRADELPEPYGLDPVVFGPYGPDSLTAQAPRDRECAPCGVRWSGGGPCWCCGRQAAD